MDSGLDAGASPRYDEGDKFEIVLDHHHRIALRHQLVQHFGSFLTSWKCGPVVGSLRMTKE